MLAVEAIDRHASIGSQLLQPCPRRSDGAGIDVQAEHQATVGDAQRGCQLAITAAQMHDQPAGDTCLLQECIGRRLRGRIGGVGLTAGQHARGDYEQTQAACTSECFPSERFLYSLSQISSSHDGVARLTC